MGAGLPPYIGSQKRGKNKGNCSILVLPFYSALGGLDDGVGRVVLHPDDPPGPEDLQPLVVAVGGEAGEVDGADGAGGEVQGDDHVVVVAQRADLRDLGVGRDEDARGELAKDPANEME